MDQRDTFSDELLSAYLDGELTPDERVRVEQLLQRNDANRQAWEELCALRADLRALPQHQLGDGFAGRVLATTQAAWEATDAGTRSAPPLKVGLARRRQRTWRRRVAVAAAVAISLLIAVLWTNRAPDSGTSVAIQSPGTGVESTVAQPVQPVQPVQPALPPERLPGAAGVTPDVAESGGVTAPRSADVTAAADTPPQFPGQPDRSPAEPMPERAVKPSAAGGVADTVLPGPGHVPATVESGQLPVSDQLLMVIDVFPTQAAVEAANFEQALAQHGVPFYASIPVDPPLEKVLISSRFFRQQQTGRDRPAQAAGGESAAAAVQLVYVVTRGGISDELWRSLREDRKHFAALFFDLAFRPAELAVFHRLREAAQATYAAENQKLAAAREAEVRRGAYRLILPPTWRGEPTRVFARSQPRNGAGGEEQPQLPSTFLPGRLGENMVVELLFVIHTPQP